MIGKTYHIQTCSWNEVCNVLFLTIKRTQASERQRAMIGKTYHILTCTWRHISNVLCFYIQAGQSQWTPARNDWKNISHPDMHLKRRLPCICFLKASGPKPVNASAEWLNKNILHTHMHLKRHLQCIRFLQSSGPKPVNASMPWLEKHITSWHAPEETSPM